MLLKTTTCLVVSLITFLSVYAQTNAPLRLAAKRTTRPVKIDGLLNDSAWKDAAMMSNLIEFRPTVGKKEDFENRTETYLMYNDDGIYFGGYCHERSKDSIATELKGRDGFGTNDYVGIIFDTYYDKLNGFEYFVTPLNEQWDSKMSPPSADSDNGGEDFSWSAVWESGAVIHNDGWSFEMFLPYSAIRFSKKDVQNWGLNITRRRRKSEQQYTWNPIDVNVNGFLTQEGIWEGISNIKPPVRLQFSPYFSVYANHYPSNVAGQKNLTGQINGGLDLKYGLNQAFTLDVTLIPDFGQVQSDNQVLNLTPFEVRFNENRTFFMEGTELFSKGNMFYSRRIGGTPLHLYDAYNNLGANEQVLKNPSESKLINASKISGRNRHGLGIGFLNAITNPQYATIEDVATKTERKVQTDPLTNYNILVLDQTLKNNSSISLVNTNVWRSGSDYDANVTAGLFDFNDKKNMWNFGGKLATSNLIGYLPGNKTQTGFSSRAYFGKVSGRFNFNISQEMTDTKYSHNDLGYFTNNNFLDHSAYVGYRWTEPKGWYNRIFLNFNTNVSRLFSQIKPLDQKFQQANFNFNSQVQTKKLSWVGMFMNYRHNQNDFYEPRREGYFFSRGSSIGWGTFFESNSAKRYSFFYEFFGRKFLDYKDYYGIDFLFNQTFRVNNKFSVMHRISLEPRFNDIGFAWSDATDIIFGRRKVNTIENVISLKYQFNNKMGITFRARHYLSNVDYAEHFTLIQSTGKLISNPTFNEPVNQNVNFFNIDMVYTWQFAPGSFLNIVWKDAAFTYHDQIERSYFKNFSNTFESDQNNNLSLKVIYFLDYLKLKKKRN
ncbi:MAG TPA: DUF5916 domain-containing protein [Flavitalea sp.]|nr:DUF5916 domain-containing protein [Flavitalea sp.]